MIQGTQHDQVVASLGRYDVLAVLGRGGMGVVYHAYDPILDRHVALKQLAPELLRQGDVVRRLRHEAISAARLRHPNIALLYEFGEADDLPFLAMEYVPGVQLRALLERGRLPIARALHILEQIADALDYAHHMGVVHCDVKPSNILVDDDDHAVLVDFGLAEIIVDSPETADTSLLGTPHYMSPEQAAGRSADGRSDQYALAAVAYELLTGVPPFHRRSAAAVVHAHLYEALPPATERCPSLPEAVNPPLLRALAKAPDARFPSAAAFVTALRLAWAAPAPQRTLSRRWMLGGMSGLALLALVLVLLQVLPITRQAPLRAAARSGVPLAQHIAWTYDPGLVGHSMPLVLGDRLVFNTLDGALVALDTKSGDMRWHQENTAASFGAPAAGAGLVFVGNTAGSVFCLDPENGTERWQQQLLGAVQHAPLRNNGQLVVTTTQGYVYVLHTGSGEIMWGRRLADNLYLTAVGAGSVFVSAGSELFALDRNSGITIWHFHASTNITTPPVVAGDLVLVGTETGLLHALRANDGQPQWQYQARSAISAAPIVRDEVIIIADQSGRLVALQPQTTQEIWSAEADAAITATPLLADNMLFVGTSGGNVYSYDARSGRQIAVTQLGGSIVATPALGSEYIYVRGNRIYALGP